MKAIKEFGVKNAIFFRELYIDFTDKNGKPHNDIFIYGKNNSGKSTILRLLSAFSWVLRRNFEHGLSEADFTPENKKNKEMIYFIKFINNEMEFEYEIEFDHKKKIIMYENLLYKDNTVEKSRFKSLYTYDSQALDGKYTFSNEVPKTISKQIIQNHNVNGREKMILAVLNAFEEKISVAAFETLTSMKYESYSNNDNFTKNISPSKSSKFSALNSQKNFKIFKEIITGFDLSIKDVIWEKASNNSEQSVIQAENYIIDLFVKNTLSDRDKKSGKKDNDILNKEFKGILKSLFENNKFFIDVSKNKHKHDIYVLKFVNYNGIQLTLADQSDGTRKIINYLISILFNRMDEMNAPIQLIDEIDSGIHPVLFESILKRALILSSKSQNIYVTHNPNVMDLVEDKGQIVLIDTEIKNHKLINKVNYLSEFKIRKDVSNSRKYFNGVFGSVPILEENE